MSAPVDANGPRWFVANVVSELVTFLVTRGFWTRALLSNPTSGRPRARTSAAARSTLTRSDMSRITATACPPMRSMAFLTSLSVCGQGRSSLAGAHYPEVARRVHSLTGRWCEFRASASGLTDV